LPIVEPGDNFYYPVGEALYSTIEILGPDVLRYWALILEEAVSAQSSPFNLVVARFFIADQEADFFPLVKAIEKAFDGGREPTVAQSSRAQTLFRWYTVGRKPVSKKAPTLLEKDKLDSRSVASRSFALFGTVRALWPPPLSCGPTAQHSAQWVFTLVDAVKNKVRSALELLSESLAHKYDGYFFVSVRQMILPAVLISNSRDRSLPLGK
jgi:hypothetical protein